MLKTKVIAADITNLTDARYFAAWGVEMLSYTGDPHSDKYLSPAEVKEISEWVEGPGTMICYPGLSIDELNLEQISLLNVDGFTISRFIDASDIPHDAPVYREANVEDIDNNTTDKLIILKASMQELADHQSTLDYLSNNTVYIDGNYSVEEIDQLIENYPIEGIVVRGGEEEKVGFKSFDEIDDIFESLETFE